MHRTTNNVNCFIFIFRLQIVLMYVVRPCHALMCIHRNFNYCSDISADMYLIHFLMHIYEINSPNIVICLRSKTFQVLVNLHFVKFSIAAEKVYQYIFHTFR